MIDYLISVDSEALLWLNSFHTRFLDSFMMLFTGRFVWIPMYASILYVLCRMYRPRQVAVIVAAIALAILLSDQTVASLLRPIFHRLRPANLDNPLSEFVTVVNGYRGGRYGFPSCHGANSAALAVLVSMIIPRRRFVWFIVCWAVVNCYTRNYLGVHYPGDILVGALIGAAYGWLCSRGAERLAGLTPSVIRKASDVRLFPMGAGWMSRIKVWDVTVAVGVATAAVLAVISIV